MTRLQTLALGIWDFIVGDDWRTAIGIVVAIGLTIFLTGAGVSSWWVLPVAVVVLLGNSLRREARRSAGPLSSSMPPGPGVQQRCRQH